MKKFSDILPTLENSDHLLRIALSHSDGSAAGIIENQPGSQGSVRVYHHLYKKFGHIDVAAAQAGLALYAEHSRDAQQHPGKHPNIDRLYAVIESRLPLTVNLVS
jgi:hypothetical protein